MIASITVPALSNRLRMLRTLVKEACTILKCSETCTEDLVLAVDEACQNVIRHAYGQKGQSDSGQKPAGEMVLTIVHRTGSIVFQLRDFGPTVDPETIKPRDLDDLRPGGLGCHFIHTIMEDVAFLDIGEEKGNILQMIKTIE
ncbi:MAG: ATP-binding protein [Magnetococcales bacterium]|nr:ATP-binding protein [Magnetococcales bacterium]